MLPFTTVLKSRILRRYLIIQFCGWYVCYFYNLLGLYHLTTFYNAQYLDAILWNICYRVTCSLVHSTLTFALNELTGEVYLNVFISGAVEFPACIAFYFILKRIGRRKAFMGSFGTAAIALFLSVPFDIIPGKYLSRYLTNQLLSTFLM